MDETPIFTNLSFEVPVVKGDKPKKHRPRLGLKKSKSKEKKGVKEKVCEKPDQKYEPLHRRKRNEEACMAWMNRVSLVLTIDKAYVREYSLKEVPS